MDISIDDYAVENYETKVIPKRCELCGEDMPQQMPDVIHEIELKKFVWNSDKRRWNQVTLSIFVCKACQDEILERYEMESIKEMERTDNA